VRATPSRQGDHLTPFDKQAATVRQAGAKMIVRFAYTDECPDDDCVAAYGGFDAPPNLVQPSRMVQVRTIPMKKNMYPTGPVTSGNAYSAARSRVSDSTTTVSCATRPTAAPTAIPPPPTWTT
jgi:hypothetical protein